jgi:hypothetical protein
MTESELRLIPPGTFRYDNRPVFVREREPGPWYVWGPEWMLAEDSVVEVYKYIENGTTPQHILRHIAYRIVRKHGGGEVKFVLCTFDDIVNEGPFEREGK